MVQAWYSEVFNRVDLCCSERKFGRALWYYHSEANKLILCLDKEMRGVTSETLMDLE